MNGAPGGANHEVELRWPDVTDLNRVESRLSLAHGDVLRVDTLAGPDRSAKLNIDPELPIYEEGVNRLLKSGYLERTQNPALGTTIGTYRLTQETGMARFAAWGVTPEEIQQAVQEDHRSTGEG